MPGLRNLNVDVAEENGNVVFLHKIVEGSADRSYGIHVAKLAGVPESLLERASQKLTELEEGQVSIELAKPAENANMSVQEEEQISFFGFAPNPVVERLKAIDLMNLTPSEAFKILEELKAAAEQ